VRGQVTRVTGRSRPVILSRIGDPQHLANSIRDDWNSVHIIARGNVLMHHRNGQLMTMVIDDDAAARTRKGLIGVQVHVGPPMQVRYRTWRWKPL
jgi:hypothetical protein